MQNAKCWIAGFPRSGNHRLRQVVYSLLWRKPFEFDTEKPEVYLDLEEAGYKKTHFLGNLVEGPAIYTIRREFYVIRSLHRYLERYIPTIEEAERIVKTGCWKKENFVKTYGSRQQNIASYINRPNTLIVHYEDFGIDQVRRIAYFLGLEPLDEIVEWVKPEVVLQKELAYKNHLGLIFSPTHIS